MSQCSIHFGYSSDDNLDNAKKVEWVGLDEFVNSKPEGKVKRFMNEYLGTWGNWEVPPSDKPKTEEELVQERIEKSKKENENMIYKHIEMDLFK